MESGLENMDSRMRNIFNLVNIYVEMSEYQNWKSLPPLLSVEKLDNGGEFIVMDRCEVLVQKPSRKDLLERLHYTHLSADSMLCMCKGSYFWPNLRSDLQNL